jgi:hypothetical protein
VDLSRCGFFGAALVVASGCAHHHRPVRTSQAATTAAAPHAPTAVTEGSVFPAQTLLGLNEDTCRAKLDHVPLEVRTSSPTRGVRDPFRLVGSVDHLAFRPSWSTKHSDPSMEVVDCRLILAFADAAPIFARHGVKGLVYLSAYRPPTGDLQASLRKSRHGAGMALDVGILERSDGTNWNITRDFPKELGRPPCDAREEQPTPGSAEDLRALVCDLAVSGLFSVVLTPNFNQDHHDHVHVELNPRVPSLYLR